MCDDIQTFNVFENGAIQYWNYYNLEQSCLTYDEVAKYIGINNNGYAWHISDLVMYDKPKELGEFYTEGKSEIDYKRDWFNDKPLTRPPQSWCYIEILEDKNVSCYSFNNVVS